MQSNQNSPASVSDPPKTCDVASDGSLETNESADCQSEILVDWASEVKDRTPKKPGVNPPVLPAKEEMSNERIAALRHGARSFHRDEPGAYDDLSPLSEDLIPALMHPFRDPDRVRHDYPLFIFDPKTAESDRLCVSLSDLLCELVDGFAAEPDEAKILKDNLPRLESALRRSLSVHESPTDAHDQITSAGKAMVAALSLSEENSQILIADLARLIESLPAGGRLLGLSQHAALHLFLLAAQHRCGQHRSAMRAKITELRHKLRDILLIDLAKEPGRQAAEMLEESVGSVATELVDLDKLAGILGPPRGVKPMDPARRKRIEGIVASLESYLIKDEPPYMRVVCRGATPPSWQSVRVDWQSPSEDTVCDAAAKLFDEQADEQADLFATMRVGELELSDAYDAVRHEHLVEGFDWEAFTRDELISLPPILAIETADELAGKGTLSISRLQLSGRPVSVMVIVDPASNPGLPPGQDELTGYRLELAYRGMSLRESVVQQSSTSQPEHLVAGFQRSLQSTRASLHVVASGFSANEESPRLGCWLHTAAALESRAHPVFRFDPGLGRTWARRFDFSGNPQADVDWPVYDLPCLTADGHEQVLRLAFTFADFALMDSSYREHFREIPSGCSDDGFITMDEYLTLPSWDFIETVPYTWAVDSKGELHQIIVNRRLASACRDRLSFFRTLQELAGINNEYVETALRQQRTRLEAEFAEERQGLQDAHTAELEEATRQAAELAMQQLAQTLLNTDVTSLSPMPTASRTAPAPAPEAPPAEEVETVEAPAAEEEDEGSEEPWINSVLCTTCNDCTNMNAQLFVYNANRQAVIGDPGAGTYAQLVEAAEKCPARCIHPGKPLNPDEPNLDELIKRAKPFN